MKKKNRKPAFLQRKKHPLVRLQTKVIHPVQSYHEQFHKFSFCCLDLIEREIDHPASQHCGTRTDFLVSAAMEKADMIIENENIIRLNRQEQ